MSPALIFYTVFFFVSTALVMLLVFVHRHVFSWLIDTSETRVILHRSDWRQVHGNHRVLVELRNISGSSGSRRVRSCS